MKIKSIQKVIFLTLCSVLIFMGCAKIVAPTGGPKDEQHPLIVESDPPNYTTNFDKDEINITFDEFIQLKDLNSNLIVSPPLDDKPMVRVKGKTLNIEFENELEDSTTYNIYFGNSVQDFNEGNPIENFQYVLSTGESIDSLSIEGTVLNSYNLLPEEGVFVMLYSEHEDSIPIKEIPHYISKTNKEGYFQINNIRHGEYKLFCLRDINRNYLFDNISEEIAFIDTLIKFELETHIHVDTIFKVDSILQVDTLFIPDSEYKIDSSYKVEYVYEPVTITEEYYTSDSIKYDSTYIIEKPVVDSIITEYHSFYPVHNMYLMLFAEDRVVQYLANNKRESREKVEFMFNKPIKDSIDFQLLDSVKISDWYIKEWNESMDTVFYWLTDSSVYNRESLEITLSYQKEDSNLVYQWTTDTLSLKFFDKKSGRKDKEKSKQDSLISYKKNITKGSTLDLNKNIKFTYDRPVEFIDTAFVYFWSVVDSVESWVDFSIKKDSIKLREYEMSASWSEDTTYRLEIFPGAFKDIYGAVNDTSIIEFKTQKRDFYGKILADIIGIDSSFQIIAQLILPAKETEIIIEEKIIRSNQIVEFSYLPPKEFIFKVIIDKNFNGKWDTGDYLKNIQPEEVLYHESQIKVRSNWDIEINFDVKRE